MKIKYLLASITLISSSNIMAQPEPRHGFIESPPSRTFLCSKQGGELNKNCGPAQYEPQSIEGLKGFPQAGPPDGAIASAGNQNFQQLNAQTPYRWHKVNISPGENIFKWSISAQHSTTSWEFFITKPDWDPNKPLTRAAFVLTPFCSQFDGGANPAKVVEIKCNVPQREGYNIILGVWTISNTANAFYQVIDANFK
ncbi:TPA: lytic polysaccharide monooxygenase [Yersinia enterocolitica]